MLLVSEVSIKIIFMMFIFCYTIMGQLSTKFEVGWNARRIVVTEKTIHLIHSCKGLHNTFVTFCRYSANCCSCRASSTDFLRIVSQEQYFSSSSLSRLFDSFSRFSISPSNSLIVYSVGKCARYSELVLFKKKFTLFY